MRVLNTAGRWLVFGTKLHSSQRQKHFSGLRSFYIRSAGPSMESGKCHPIVLDDDSNAKTYNHFSATVRSAIARSKEEKHEPIRVAFDCEGIAKGRLGGIEILTLRFDSATYLIDLACDPKMRKKRLGQIRPLLECKRIEKIVHDCRKDSDVLFHVCNIKLNNVHDTSCFHQIIFPDENGKPGLAKMLGANGFVVEKKPNSFFVGKPDFWRNRPLTEEMVAMAVNDVDYLLEAASIQTLKLSAEEKEEAKLLSTHYSNDLRTRNVVRLKSLKQKKGLDRGVEHTSGAKIYPWSGEENTYLVYYTCQKMLKHVKKRFGYRKGEAQDGQ